MLDVRQIRAEPDKVREGIAAKGETADLDRWLELLGRLIQDEPEPTLATALAALATIGVDVAAVRREVARYERAREADWHPDDWRRSHPEFPLRPSWATRSDP